MINKTARQNAEMAVGIKEICELNPRLTKESEVSAYAYNTLASDIEAGKEIDWDLIALLDFKDKKADIEYSDTRAITADEHDFEVVLENYKKRPGVNKVQFAYLTRLVLLYTRKKLREATGRRERTASEKIEVEKVDAAELIKRVVNRTYELIMTGRIDRIEAFLEED
ncbi:MAG: hypothetical protein K6G16_02075 [Lachnospiraceae bacterium]|nr:hypothetical protein [Lachnospiraceae bacterium]